MSEILGRRDRKRLGQDPTAEPISSLQRSGSKESLRGRPPVPVVAFPPMSPKALASCSSPDGEGGPPTFGALNVASLQAHTEKNPMLKGIGDAARASNPGGDDRHCPSVHGSELAPRLRRASSREQVDADETLTEAPTEYSQAESLPPVGLGPKARWEWKLRQLSYVGALSFHKKSGRERKTAMMYANDADRLTKNWSLLVGSRSM